MRSSTLTRLSVAGFLVFLGIGYAYKAGAVRNGLPAAAGGPVFLITHGLTMISGGFVPNSVGTTGAAKMPRCLITAAHVNPQPGDTILDMGPTAPITTSTPRQYAQNVGYASAVQADWPWEDIAVVWASNFQNQFGLPRKIPLASWAPLTVSKTEGLGLQPINYTSDETIPSPGGPVAVHLVGYGSTGSFVTTVQTSSNTSISVFTDYTPNGIKTEGHPNATAFYLGSSYVVSPGPGSIVRSLPVNSDGKRMGCRGDSGAPLKSGASTYGVLSLALGTGAGLGQGGLACAEYVSNIYTGFDDTNNNGGETNWSRVNRLMKTTCGKTARTGVSVYGGRVDGSLLPSQASPPVGGISFNSSMHCGAGVPVDAQDCEEFMHDGETMNLTAIPSTGWKFLQWVTNNNCPCDGSTNPSCSMPYNAMGTYTSTVSFDESSCIASFVPTICGDYTVDPNEQCDQGGMNTPTCDADCTLPVCGDGLMNPAAGEQCDDGNIHAGDGCSPTCKLEICGNNVVDPGEQCDAGMMGSATCNPNCTNSVCGDGIVNSLAGEQCDDGTNNGKPGDLCSTTCQFVSSSSMGMMSSAAFSSAGGVSSVAGFSSSAALSSAAPGTCTTDADCSGIISCTNSCCVTYTCSAGMCIPAGSCP